MLSQHAARQRLAVLRAEVEKLRLEIQVERVARKLVEQKLWRICGLFGLAPTTLDDLVKQRGERLAAAALEEVIRNF